MKVRNAKPTFFYGMHFEDGIAEYKDMEGEPVIYINDVTARTMDKTFQGKPVFVMHIDEEPDFENVHGEADGIVIRSFYNKSDGKHWAEFVVYTDEGLQAIAQGMKLSNAYGITQERGAGTWHGANYDREVAGAEYEHLAIVPNPRYQDSIILTPDQFKAYNNEKEEELIRIANSKPQGDNMKFNLFKKEAVKNSTELELMSVMLPKSKVEKTITQLVNEADKLEENKGKPVLVNSTDLVKFDGEEITVASLIKMHNELKEEMENMDDEDKPENEDDDKPENMDEDDMDNEDDEDKPENEDDKDKPENEDEEDEDKKKNKKGYKNKKKNSLANAKEAHEKALRNYNKLKNAGSATPKKVANIDMSADKIARGKARYGSN